MEKKDILYRQQLQNFLVQKEALRLQLSEIETALKELKKSKRAYRIVGRVMVEKPVEELKGELEDVKEDIEVRIKSMDEAIKKIEEKIKGEKGG